MAWAVAAIIGCAASCRSLATTSSTSARERTSPKVTRNPHDAYACWLDDPALRNFVAREVTSYIRGRVEDQGGHGLGSMRVWVVVNDKSKRGNGTDGGLGGAYYTLWTTTGDDGGFALPMIDVAPALVMVRAARVRDQQNQQWVENVPVDCPDLVIKMAW
jgi:hypothetical protein